MSRHGYSRKSNASIFKGTLHSSHSVLPSQFGKWSQQGKEHCWALPTAFWLLQSKDCRIWFEKLPKKKKGPSSKLVQRIGPKTTLLQSLSFVFYLPWEACESCAPTLTPKLQIPVLQVPTDSQAQQKEAVSLRGEVCFRSGGLLHRADGTSMGWGN